MTKPPCIRCGRRGEQQHHLSGRDEGGDQMNDDLVVWLCRPCHLGDHNTRHILELEGVAGPLSIPERVELCLRRVAAFLAHLGAPWDVLSGSLAAAMSGWANDLAAHRLKLDKHYPDWRTLLG
jgi:hypothetical protein